MKESKPLLTLQKNKTHCVQVKPPSEKVHLSRTVSYTLILRLPPHPSVAENCKGKPDWQFEALIQKKWSKKFLFPPKLGYVKQNYIIGTALDSGLIEDSLHVCWAGSGSGQYNAYSSVFMHTKKQSFNFVCVKLRFSDFFSQLIPFL